jgi:AcrR family transcriptional regulator
VTGARAEGDSSALSAESIVEAALLLLERDGLDAFSMRGLARECGVYPAALYWHVTDKERLLALVTMRIVGDIDIPDPRLPWDTWVAEMARRYRRALHRHAAASPLISGHLVSNSANAFPIAETLLEVLSGAGFRMAGLVDAYNVVVGFMIGFVGLELARAPDLDGPWQQQRRDELDRVDPEVFPRLAAHRALLANRAFITRWQSGSAAPMDAAFEASLDVVLRGLRARLDDGAGG